MNKMIGKLRSTRGETLAEILVSIVILGLSIGLMLTMIMTSTKITQNARKADNDLMTELNAAEQQSSSTDIVDVTIYKDGSPSDSIRVEAYIFKDTTLGKDNTLISYKAK